MLYLGAVSLVVVAGLWGARVSWRGRIGWAHVLAVITIIWGLASHRARSAAARRLREGAARLALPRRPRGGDERDSVLGRGALVEEASDRAR